MNPVSHPTSQSPRRTKFMHTIRQATIDDAEAIDSIWRQRLDEDQPPDEGSLKHFQKMLGEQDDVFK